MSGDWQHQGSDGFLGASTQLENKDIKETNRS